MRAEAMARGWGDVTLHLSEPRTLQEDTEGMSGIIDAGAMVIDGLYYNGVQHAPYWYTPSETTTVVQVRHVL